MITHHSNPYSQVLLGLGFFVCMGVFVVFFFGAMLLKYKYDVDQGKLSILYTVYFHFSKLIRAAEDIDCLCLFVST